VAFTGDIGHALYDLGMACPPKVPMMEMWSSVAMLGGGGTFKRWGVVEDK
jgi:hypothetical protein